MNAQITDIDNQIVQLRSAAENLRAKGADSRCSCGARDHDGAARLSGCPQGRAPAPSAGIRAKRKFAVHINGGHRTLSNDSSTRSPQRREAERTRPAPSATILPPCPRPCVPISRASAHCCTDSPQGKSHAPQASTPHERTREVKGAAARRFIIGIGEAPVCGPSKSRIAARPLWKAGCPGPLCLPLDGGCRLFASHDVAQAVASLRRMVARRRWKWIARCSGPGIRASSNP